MVSACALIYYCMFQITFTFNPWVFSVNFYIKPPLCSHHPFSGLWTCCLKAGGFPTGGGGGLSNPILSPILHNYNFQCLYRYFKYCTQDQLILKFLRYRGIYHIYQYLLDILQSTCIYEYMYSLLKDNLQQELLWFIGDI